VEECLDHYGGLIWTLARRLSPGPSDAEDAVQEIFLEIWKHAGRFDPRRGSEKTFVTTLARRRLIDRRRNAGRRPDLRPLPAPVDGEESPALAQPGHEDVERSTDAALAARELREIRPEQRRVIELVVRQGLTHREVARLIDLPLGTVKSHLNRGLAAVRKRLERVTGRALT